MTTVTVIYHYVDGSWWAEADGHPGYLAVANTLDELRELVREGLPFSLEVDHVEIDARYDVETVDTENPERSGAGRSDGHIDGESSRSTGFHGGRGRSEAFASPPPGAVHVDSRSHDERLTCTPSFSSPTLRR